MAENPPLNRIYVLGYSANDRDYPIVSLNADPRVAGYKVPEDLSTCPDKRYPNHVFTGAQPISGDERVRHVWEILPSPWVPFTRYDDDLGPVQGRRRSVKNEGQVASLTADKRTTYEAREGSAIVYTELEEAWSIATDEDGNSLFPVRDRDFYDPSRGAVQERRQLFVPTGEEEGSLENVNGVITQTSYEPYNEFLSVKIVQTYKVDGPQLIGKATDNEGQLVTITTQRRAADGYVPPSPTATRTVEVSREDAESLVERIVDTPQVFGAEVYRKTREDLTPQKFKAAQEDSTVEQNIEGTATPSITLGVGEFAKSEQQINKFIKRVATTSRSTTVNPDPLVEKVLTNEGQIGTRTLTLASGPQSFDPSATLIDANVEALGDGRTVKSETTVENVFGGKSITKTKIDLTPEKFKAAQEDTTVEENIEGAINPSISLATGEFRKSEQQVTEFVKRTSTTSRITEVNPDPLIETVITPQGQVATRTLRLSAQAQSIQPDALLTDGSIEALGDGRTVKTEVRVPAVFEGKTLSLDKPDVTPEKFRAKVPASSIETSVAGTVTDPIALAGNEISKSEQQVTEFVKRVRAVTRDSAAEGTLTGEVFTGELGGGTATVTEKYGANPQINPDYGTVAAEKEALGDGKFVTREVVLSNPPVLTGQEYDDQLDIVFPFTQQFVEPNTGVGDARTEVQPRDVHHSLKRNIDINQFRTAALNQHWAIADVVNVNLPDRLTGVDILKTVTRATGESNSVGSTGWTCRATGSSDITYSVRPTIINGYSGLVSATRFVFFLDKSNSTMSSVLSKLTSLYGASVIMWPVLKPEPVTITLNGGSLSQTKETELRVLFVGNEAQAGQGGASSSISHDTNLQTSIVNIPPTLHESIDFNKIINGGAGNEWYTYRLQAAFSAPSLPAGLDEANVDDVNVNVLLDSSEIAYYPESVEATTPASFPSGNYLVSLDSESFRYGLVRFTAVVAHITPSYV